MFFAKGHAKFQANRSRRSRVIALTPETAYWLTRRLSWIQDGCRNFLNKTTELDASTFLRKKKKKISPAINSTRLFEFSKVENHPKRLKRSRLNRPKMKNFDISRQLIKFPQNVIFFYFWVFFKVEKHQKKSKTVQIGLK